MMTTQNSIMNLLIAKAIARTGSTALDPAASTYLSDGEVAVVDLDGTILDSTTVVGKRKIKLIQSQGASLPSIQTPEIELAGVKTYLGKAYTAPTVQIDYIGYNVVTNTGSLDVINDNGYEILIHDINSAAYGSTGVDKFGFYVSDSAATQAEVMDGLAVNLYQNTAKVVRKPFIVERVASVIAGTNTTAAAGSLVFTNGSNIVTYSGATPATDGLALGAYVKTDDIAVDTGVLYKITSAVTAGSFTIDQPYQGSTATFTAGNASVYTAAQLNGGSLGIRLTGLAPVFTSPQSTEYYVNRWEASIRNGGATTVTNAQGATEGVGSYAAVASLEYFLIGNEGFISRNDIPYVNPRANAVSTSTYGFITLEWDSVKTGQIFAQEPNSKQLLIAFATGGSREQLTGAANNTSVQTVLNAWLSTFTALALA